MADLFYYNGDLYARRTEADQMKGFLIASALSAGAYKSLGLFGIPLQRQIKNEIPNNEHYKNVLPKAFDISGMRSKGVKLVEAQREPNIPLEFRQGKNACYDSFNNKIIVNTDKAAISAFHELGHAMNNLNGGLPRLLQKSRKAGYIVAGLMEYFAIFSRTKPKEAQKTFTDKVENNCGKIAFLALLPVVLEEALASHKGIKLAKQAGLKEPYIKKMKILLSKALLTYGARATIGALAVWGSRKIMDYYTTPQKVNDDVYNIFG